MHMMVQASPPGASWLHDTGVCLSFCGCLVYVQDLHCNHHQTAIQGEQSEDPDKSAWRVERPRDRPQASARVIQGF